MPYLLYLANLHVGGGIQVATSVITELSQIQGGHPRLAIWASTVVDQNLRDFEINTDCFMDYRVVDHRGIRAFFSADRRLMEGFSCVFALFGPLYFPKLNTRTVIGFAQSWITQPDNQAYQLLPLFQRSILKLKFSIQKWFFRFADELVVELEHVKDDLICSKIGNSKNIHVVHNCVSTLYLEPSLWRPINFGPNEGVLRLGSLGRNYVHKNNQILPEIKKILQDYHGIQAQFLVTFTDEEWSRCSKNFKREVTNVGILAVAQCPSFYSQLDGVVFPSLLECFSATPLEALAMERPLFASDRPFVRDICGDFAIYFNPMSPGDAALKIAQYFQESKARHYLGLSQQHALNFSSPKIRALEYLKLLTMPHGVVSD